MSFLPDPLHLQTQLSRVASRRRGDFDPEKEPEEPAIAVLGPGRSPGAFVGLSNSCVNPSVTLAAYVCAS
jgi:hypothetical protein